MHYLRMHICVHYKLHHLLSKLFGKQVDLLATKLTSDSHSLLSGVLFYCVYPTDNHARCLQAALAARADVNSISSRGVHVLQLMCEKAQGRISMCLHMLENGADPNARNVVRNGRGTILMR